jgi:hypothetical protein
VSSLRDGWTELRAHPWRPVVGAVFGATVGVMPFTGDDSGAVVLFLFVGAFAVSLLLNHFEAQVENIRWRVLAWHPGQLVLVWVAAAGLEFLLLKAFGGDVTSPFALLLDRTSRILSLSAQPPRFRIVFEDPDPWFEQYQAPLAILYICTPIVMFVVSWIWCDRRR